MGNRVSAEEACFGIEGDSQASPNSVSGAFSTVAKAGGGLGEALETSFW